MWVSPFLGTKVFQRKLSQAVCPPLPGLCQWLVGEPGPTLSHALLLFLLAFPAYLVLLPLSGFASPNALLPESNCRVLASIAPTPLFSRPGSDCSLLPCSHFLLSTPCLYADPSSSRAAEHHRLNCCPRAPPSEVAWAVHWPTWPS